MSNAKDSKYIIELSVDVFNLSFIFLLFILTLLNTSAVPDWQSNIVKLVIALILYPASVYLLTKVRDESVHTSLHIFLVVGLYSLLFQAIAPLQHIIHPDWLDTEIIFLETTIIGSEFSLFLDQYTHPILTEWMMFAYVIYVPLVPAIAFHMLFFSRSRGSRIVFTHS